MSNKNYIQLQRDIFNSSLSAFEKLYKEFFSTLVLYSESITKDKDKSESIIQELFCTIWDERVKILQIQSIKAYLYQSAKNRSLTYLRYNNKFEKEDVIPDVESDNILSEIFENEVYKELYDAINQLSPKCKEVFMLKLKGLSDKDISTRLDISVDTVRTHIKKGYRQLRKQMKLAILLIPFIF